MIAIAGGKGGSGKTTTTLGLARALARTDRSVLAVDADRDMPNLHALAGVPASPSSETVDRGDAAGEDDRDPAAVAHPDPAVSGVRVLPAPREAGPLDGAALSRLRRSSRRVLIDCPAGAGPDAAAPLRAADATVVVTLPTPESLRDAAKTAAMARALDAPVAAAVVTRAESPPEGVRRLLETDRVVAVPDGGERPLRASGVDDAYRRLGVLVCNLN
ncbi:P-loop NTPase [Halostella sp. JP-L12]|uniref:MinD/ParA family ATP-binding protein n=1 Tax=Halostella TaxID=1843185 RepID=UPI000EF75B82|nr:MULTISPECIES: P-loop NTPase [Halostella]NHN48804.1 P-loop NTPase [Halostella sp. JP-L12]